MGLIRLLPRHMQHSTAHGSEFRTTVAPRCRRRKKNATSAAARVSQLLVKFGAKQADPSSRQGSLQVSRTPRDPASKGGYSVNGSGDTRQGAQLPLNSSGSRPLGQGLRENSGIRPTMLRNESATADKGPSVRKDGATQRMQLIDIDVAWLTTRTCLFGLLVLSLLASFVAATVRMCWTKWKSLQHSRAAPPQVLKAPLLLGSPMPIAVQLKQ